MEEGGEEVVGRKAWRQVQDQRLWDYVELAHCAAIASRNDSSSHSSGTGTGGGEQWGRLLHATLEPAQDALHPVVREWEAFLSGVVGR